MGDETASEGLRARKRRETRHRITEAGVGLFLRQGYDRTTIDDIAAAAGVSRRSFFHYFPAKDEVLVSLQAGMGEAIAAAVRDAPADARPFEAVRDAVIAVCGAYDPDELIAIDRLMRSSPTVQARKVASYVAQEAILLAALRDRWPDPERETGLRLVALLTLGAVRMSVDAFSRENGRRPLVDLLAEAFTAAQQEL